MSPLKHEFTDTILEVLDRNSGNSGKELLGSSEILQYLNMKTKAANRGSKSRASYANIYAIYVLVEDYINGNFSKDNPYSEYEGAKFSDLFKRQRELPFGSKLQNHALNHRLNEEFKKFFPSCENQPIIRDSASNRAFDADVFFDDQKIHCDSASGHVATAHVPHGVANE